MSLLGKKIFLKGISQKGKNRIRTHGEWWTVFAETDKIIFSVEPGPWIFVAPYAEPHTHKAARWVHATKDVDFEVTPLDRQ